MKPDIKLVKPPADEAGFDRGERVIMVDGVRWGRTIVTYHGSHGTRFRFKQEAGGIVTVPGTLRSDREREVEVSSKKRRRLYHGDLRPNAVAVLEKVRELIAAGKLRHPDVVKEEKEQRNREWQKRQAEGEAKKNALFDAKARETLGIPGQPGLTNGELIDRVVAAMKWAQSQ